MNSIRLVSLLSLPRLPCLEELQAGDNHLAALTAMEDLFPSVEILHVGNNRLSTIRDVSPIGGLGSLSELQLEGNPLCGSCDQYAVIIIIEAAVCKQGRLMPSGYSTHSYRVEVKGLVPSLEIIDGVRV